LGGITPPPPLIRAGGDRRRGAGCQGQAKSLRKGGKPRKRGNERYRMKSRAFIILRGKTWKNEIIQG
jgi:hypothetical protein